jgi:hypothetical protein
LPPDADLAGVEVDVLPCEAESLAAPQTENEAEHVRGVEWVCVPL